MTQGSPAPTVLHQFFESAAQRWPQRIAVDVPPGHGRPQRRVITYAELARQAAEVSAALGALPPDSIVAILLPRDSERIYSAQIGALQAGGAYTHIEPSFPDGRIREILDDSRPAALLTDADGAERARTAGFRGPILMVHALPPASPIAIPCPDKVRIKS